MSDVMAGPPPERLWAVRFQDGGGWRLIGSADTMRVLRQQGRVREEHEYMPVAGLGRAVPMSAPLAQAMGYGDASTLVANADVAEFEGEQPLDAGAGNPGLDS